jgi:hypothetical protein
MRRWSFIPLALPVLTALAVGGAFAGSLPQEPEQDNREYLLDIVTNFYSRDWREAWDAGDNRFRFRLGSNKVTQWFIEEELKLSVPLNDRFRFRFHHARLLHYTTEEIPWDALEFEGRLHNDVFLSVYARPDFDKRESAIGLMLQSRRAVNRYVKLSVEWPGFMRNFAEHHRETSDSLLNIFTDQPVRFTLDLREELSPNLWVRLFGEVIPRFGMGEEVTKTGERFETDRGEAEGIGGWVEYVWDPSRQVRDQFAFGVEADYQRSRQTKPSAASPTFGSENGAFFASREDDILTRTPELRFDQDLYEPTSDDTVNAWRDTRSFVSPYLWVPVGERVVVNATLRFDRRKISVGNTDGQTFTTRNEYVVPRLGASYAFGAERRLLLESGWVAEFRTRKVEEEKSIGPAVELSREDIDDHRLYLALEYRFSQTNMIRLNESFELDKRDRGQFGIHDHGFFQVIVGF